MSKKVSFKPEGYHTLTPYLTVHNANEAIAFYKKALGATELMRMDGPGGKVMHAEMKIGDSCFMLADEFPEMGNKSPKTLGGAGMSLMAYVEDVDFASQQASQAGMKTLREVKDQFYGDRSGTFQDPFGHNWTLATHTEDVTPAEMERRMSQMKG